MSSPQEIESENNSRFATTTIKGGPVANAAIPRVAQIMRTRLGSRQDLADSIIPEFPRWMSSPYAWRWVRIIGAKGRRAATDCLVWPGIWKLCANPMSILLPCPLSASYQPASSLPMAKSTHVMYVCQGPCGHASGCRLSSRGQIIVCATGFDVSDMPKWHTVGKGGYMFTPEWGKSPSAYMSTSLKSMPNYFCSSPRVDLASTGASTGRRLI